MIKMGEVECPIFLRRWEEELGNKISVSEGGLLLGRVNATSVNYRVSEMNFRILARMYITPDRAHKIQKETSQLCWRGCKDIGTMAHIWWQCPGMKKFWGEIRSNIFEITSMRIPDDPWVCLHHGSNMPTKRYLKSLLPHLLNAAKSLIPRYWLDRRRPTMREWFNKIEEIHCLEYLRYSEGLEMKSMKRHGVIR